jgi:hypothetical protein
MKLMFSIRGGVDEYRALIEGAPNKEIHHGKLHFEYSLKEFVVSRDISFSLGYSYLGRSITGRVFLDSMKDAKSQMGQVHQHLEELLHRSIGRLSYNPAATYEKSYDCKDYITRTGDTSLTWLKGVFSNQQIH